MSFKSELEEIPTWLTSGIVQGKKLRPAVTNVTFCARAVG